MTVSFPAACVHESHPIRAARACARWPSSRCAAWPLVGCSRRDSRELQPGSYRATVELPGGKPVPFGLDVAREETGTVSTWSTVRKGSGCRRSRPSRARFTARMPGYENTLSATVCGRGTRGRVCARARGRPGPQAAVHGPARRNLAFPPRTARRQRRHGGPLGRDLHGRCRARRRQAWRRSTSVSRRSPARSCCPPPTSVTSRVRSTTRLCASRASTAAPCCSMRRKLNAEGELVGDFWSDRGGHQRFVARRNPDAGVDASAVATRLRDPAARFEFSFKDRRARSCRRATRGSRARSCW